MTGLRYCNGEEIEEVEGEIEIDDVVEALDRYTDAKIIYKERYKELENSGEYEIGYYITPERDKMEESMKKFKETLDRYIDNRVIKLMPSIGPAM